MLLAGEGFKPAFFDLRDLHVFGYPNEQYNGVRRANDELANRLRNIDEDIFENEGHLSLTEGSFMWTPAWGTVTQPVI